MLCIYTVAGTHPLAVGERLVPSPDEQLASLDGGVASGTSTEDTACGHGHS